MATIKKPIRIGDDTPLRNFQAGEAVGPDHGGTGLVTSDLAGQSLKYLQVNVGETGFQFGTPSGGGTDLTFTGAASPFTLNSSTGTDVTIAAGANVTLSRSGNELTIAASGGGGGGGDSLGMGFTAGGGSGDIPDGTTATILGTLDFLGNGIASSFINIYVPTTFSEAGVTFNGAAIFNDLVTFNGFAAVSFSGGVISPTFYASGAGGAIGAVIDVTEDAEKIDFAVNDSPKLSIDRNGTVSMPTNAGAFVPPRLTESERDALTPSAGWTIYCTDATANDGSTGVLQTYNGSTWKNHW